MREGYGAFYRPLLGSANSGSVTLQSELSYTISGLKDKNVGSYRLDMAFRTFFLVSRH
jgi:hypothetical protein